jgi:hypothetical protein
VVWLVLAVFGKSEVAVHDTFAKSNTMLHSVNVLPMTEVGLTSFNFGTLNCAHSLNFPY